MRSSWSTTAGCMLLMLAVTIGAVLLFAAVFSGVLFYGSP